MEGCIIMREENYFKIKLQMSIDNLSMAKRKLEHLDIQINLLKVRFDHDKKVYDDQAIHMQNIVKDMEKRIPKLEKKLKEGYTTIDMRTGKAFKSFEARHVGLLQDKIKETEQRQKAQAEAYKKKLALRKKKRDKLSDEELDIVIAEEVRESAQPADELQTNREKEKERLEQKLADYAIQLEELKNPKKVKELIPLETRFDAVGNEVVKPIKTIKTVVNDILEEAEDEIIEALDGDTAEVSEEFGKIWNKHTKGVVGTQPDVSFEVILEEKAEIAEEMRRIADEMNGETKELQWLTAKRPDWIEQFELEEGGKAVWQGRITNGFKQWCEAKGYKIGG